MEPTPVLELIREQGYGSKVVTTPEELQFAIQRVKAALERRASSPSFRSGSSAGFGFGSGSITVGLLLGAFLGGD